MVFNLVVYNLVVLDKNLKREIEEVVLEESKIGIDDFGLFVLFFIVDLFKLGF